MPTCIYCRGGEPELATFHGVEHVLPDAFGRFDANLTLSESVCDDCNGFFGKTIDLSLARDTPFGLARYFAGQKKAEGYKHLGHRATLGHRLAESRLAGAFLEMKPRDGALDAQPFPQIGFGPTSDGPFKWYLLSALPDKDALRRLFDDGDRFIEFLDVLDTDGAVAALRERGVKFQGDLIETGPGGEMGRHRVESASLLTSIFGRALAKIGLNYLTSQFGGSSALLPAFDAVRNYVRRDTPLPVGTWWSLPVPQGGGADGAHAVVISSDDATRKASADICFFGQRRFRVVLSDRGLLVTFPPRGHRWDLSTMTVEALPSWSVTNWI